MRQVMKATKAAETATRESADNGSEIVRNCEEMLRISAAASQSQHTTVLSLLEKVQEPSKDLEGHFKKVLSFVNFPFELLTFFSSSSFFLFFPSRPFPNLGELMTSCALSSLRRRESR